MFTVDAVTPRVISKRHGSAKELDIFALQTLRDVIWVDEASRRVRPLRFCRNNSAGRLVHLWFTGWYHSNHVLLSQFDTTEVDIDTWH